MARQVLETQPWRKLFEVYQDFSGGLNVMDANEKLSDSEQTSLVNVELGERGSLKRRTGYDLHRPSPEIDKNVQGYFRYFSDEAPEREILAIGGQLYVSTVGDTETGWQPLTITNLASFQTTSRIEAVQVQNKLYIATGTKLVEYDGTEAKVVVPKQPDALEALYIGTNGLADNPDQYLTDGTSAFLQLEGVIPDKRYGIINKVNTFNVFVSKPAAMVVEYNAKWREQGTDDTWSEGTWRLTNDINFKATRTSDWEFIFEVRDQANPTEVFEYILPQYSVKATDENKVEPYEDIHSCKRILLHWGRLLLYNGNDADLVYISHLNEPDYFPTLNTLRFENEWREGVTNIVQYRDMLVIFTPSTIQALFGKSPTDYSRVILNSSIGCVTPQTARVVGNHIVFHSHDGFYRLKSVGTSESRANVEKIDIKIHDLVPKSSTQNACSVVYDNQYIAYFADEKKAFRYYYEYGTWVTDESDTLDIVQSLTFSGELYIVRLQGDVLKKSFTSYMDHYDTYEMKIETKYYTFGQPLHSKKLKELHVLVSNFDIDSKANLYLYADSQLVINPSESKAVVNESGYVEWEVTDTPNIISKAGTTFGGWIVGESPFGSQDASEHQLKISGKCRKTKVVITHKEATPFQLIGLAFTFKLKQP